ncbi:MAG: four helix bundle protein [Sandaracinaceae bacterium]
MKLRIYDDAVAMVTEVRAYRLAIAREDADHARQLRRAAKSVPLNIAEGAYSRGRNRHSRYHTALGSANEVVACLEVAVADGILDSIDPDVLDRLIKIIGTLVKLADK